MRTCFVVNPVAGRGRGWRVWRDLQPVLAGFENWTVCLTQARGHAVELARRAAEEGAERVVAVGGDGTVCEVANGLVGAADVALGMVPTGTGDDIARCLDVPADPQSALRLALTGDTRPLDVGEVRAGGCSRYFLGVAGFGFDAEVAASVNPRLKRLGGSVPYLVSVVLTLWRFRPLGMTLRVDGNEMSRRIFMVAVANTTTYGGGMRIAPRAVPTDGQFDVCLVGDLSSLEVLRVLPAVYRGRHVGHRAVTMLRCRELDAEAAARIRVHADGEAVGKLPARFILHPGLLKVIRQ